MLDLRPSPTQEVVRRSTGGKLNLSASFDSEIDLDTDFEQSADLSFLDPPNGTGELGYISHYRVIRILGAGGMGLVFEAEDTHLKRTVALKVMKREFVDSYSSRERFLLEARAAAALDSDHIVTVHQVGMAKDVPYLAMQLLHGEPLDARLEREAPLPMPEAMLIARQTAEGLASAHSRGLVHRDIKPANIWLESDERTKAFKRVKLLDFGLARMLETTRKLTNVGMIVGTPQYMSPEQASGTPVDCRSDLFSLGTVLFVMLTGRLPFNAATSPAMLLEIVTKNPPRPSSINRLIPNEVDDLILKLMEKNPDQRPATAQDVADLLDAILVEYSFLMPGRPSGVVGYPTRDTSGMAGNLFNPTLLERATTPTMQINALPLMMPAEASPTPAPVVTPGPVSANPFAELEVDLASLPFVPHGSSSTRMQPPPPPYSVWKVVAAVVAVTVVLCAAVYAAI